MCTASSCPRVRARVATRPNPVNVTASRPSVSTVHEASIHPASVLRLDPSIKSERDWTLHLIAPQSLPKRHPLQQRMNPRPFLAALCPRPASGMGSQQGGQGGHSKGRVKDTSLRPLRVAERLRGGLQHGKPYVSGPYISL